MDELLSQRGAQARQFLLVAQFLRGDGFIEHLGVGAIIKAGRKIGERPVGPHGQHAFRAVFAKVGVGFTVALALGLALIVLLALAVRQLGPGVDLLHLSAAAVGLVLPVFAGLGFVLAFVPPGLESGSTPVRIRCSYTRYIWGVSFL